MAPQCISCYMGRLGTLACIEEQNHRIHLVLRMSLVEGNGKWPRRRLVHVATPRCPEPGTGKEFGRLFSFTRLDEWQVVRVLSEGASDVLSTQTHTHNLDHFPSSPLALEFRSFCLPATPTS